LLGGQVRELLEEHRIHKVGANLKKTKSKYANARPSRRSSKLGETMEQKPGHLVLVLPRKRGFCRIFAAHLWAHASKINAWPRLAFQIIPMPINTAIQSRDCEKV